MKKPVLWKIVLGALIVIGAGSRSPMDTLDVFGVLAGLGLVAWGVAGLFRGQRSSSASAQEPKPTTLPDDHTLHKEEFAVVGMTYHQESIQRLQVANPQWRTAKDKLIAAGMAEKRIYHYSFINKPVVLERDASGEFGADAVKVLIAGEHVGYVSQESDHHVAEILQYGSVKYITARITGGEFKIIHEDGAVWENEDALRITLHVGYSV